MASTDSKSSLQANIKGAAKLKNQEELIVLGSQPLNNKDKGNNYNNLNKPEAHLQKWLEQTYRAYTEAQWQWESSWTKFKIINKVEIQLLFNF